MWRRAFLRLVSGVVRNSMPLRTPRSVCLLIALAAAGLSYWTAALDVVPIALGSAAVAMLCLLLGLVP